MAWDQKTWYEERGRTLAKARYAEKRAELLEYQRNRLKNPVNKARQQFATARARAKRKGIPFTITFEELVWPERCPILGVLLTWEGSRWDSPSLDRVDPAKGYVSGNVRVISDLANSMKMHATADQLKAFANNILPYLEESGA